MRVKDHTVLLCFTAETNIKINIDYIYIYIYYYFFGSVGDSRETTNCFENYQIKKKNQKCSGSTCLKAF